MQNKLDEVLLEKVFGKADEENLGREIPLVEVPDQLSEKLYSICDGGKRNPRFFGLPIFASIAASIFIALTLHIYFADLRRDQEAAKAGQELLLAFEYMGKANASVVTHIERPLVEASLLRVIDVVRWQ